MLRYFVPYERIGKLQLRNRFVKGKRIWKSVSKATKPTIWSKSQKSSKPVEAFASPWTNNKPICQKPNMLLQKYSSFNKEFYLDCCWRTSRNSLIILTVKKEEWENKVTSFGDYPIWWYDFTLIATILCLYLYIILEYSYKIVDLLLAAISVSIPTNVKVVLEQDERSSNSQVWSNKFWKYQCTSQWTWYTREDIRKCI